MRSEVPPFVDAVSTLRSSFSRRRLFHRLLGAQRRDDLMEIESWCEQLRICRESRAAREVSPHSQCLDREAQSKVTCADRAVARGMQQLHPTPAQRPIASDPGSGHPDKSTTLPAEPHGFYLGSSSRY